MAGEVPLLQQTDRGPTLLFRDVAFYPGPDPVEYARRKARVFSCEPRTLVFVPSVGLGHGLTELLERIPPDSFVLCVEAFQEVMAVAMQAGIPRDPRLLVVRASEPVVVAEAVRRIGPGRFRRVREAVLCGGYRLASGLYRELRAAAEDEIGRWWRNRVTLMALGSLQVRNILANLPLFPAAVDFGELSTGLPVVVAGAGPSLGLTIPALHRVRRKYTLVAVDTALPCLRASGLVPDLVMALEAQHANLADFVPGTDHDTVLACDISTHPSVTRLFAGRLCLFSSAFAELRLFDRMAACGILPAVIPALGSVGVAAAWAALRLTRGPVFLTGLDFSYSFGMTHARGAASHLSALVRATRLLPPGEESLVAILSRGAVPAPSKDGGRVLTDRVLRSYRDSLAAIVAAESARVADAGPVGLDLGAHRVDPEEMVGILSDSAAAPGLSIGRRPFTADRVRAFLAGEASLLRRAAAVRTDSDECAALLEEARHAWLHFPDEPDLEHPAPDFVARVRVAAGYYLRLVERLESSV